MPLFRRSAIQAHRKAVLFPVFGELNYSQTSFLSPGRLQVAHTSKNNSPGPVYALTPCFARTASSSILHTLAFP